MKAEVISPFQSANGKTFHPGDIIETEPEKLLLLEQRGRVRIVFDRNEDGEILIDGLPFRPDLTEPFRGPCVVHDPRVCSHLSHAGEAVK